VGNANKDRHVDIIRQAALQDALLAGAGIVVVLAILGSIVWLVL